MLNMSIYGDGNIRPSAGISHAVILTSSKTYSTFAPSAPVPHGEAAMQPYAVQIKVITKFHFGRRDRMTKYALRSILNSEREPAGVLK
jgi:hypothetical protein